MRPTIAILGPGKVGTALGIAAHRAGYRIAAMGGRAAEAARQAAGLIGADVAALPLEAAAGAGELVLVTVSDDAISPLATELAAKKSFRQGAIIAHCGGALGSEALAAAKSSCGGAAASMHPLQTFPTVQAAVERLPGTPFFIEGDKAAANALEQLARDLGGQPVRIAPAAKTLYHAAAVTACNYLAALMDAATTLMTQAGLARKEALAALQPIVWATLDNVFKLGPADALTGPIARGDAQTVRRHMEALKASPAALENLYRALGLWTVQLAMTKGTLDAPTTEVMKKLLET